MKIILKLILICLILNIVYSLKFGNKNKLQKMNLANQLLKDYEQFSHKMYNLEHSKG